MKKPDSSYRLIQLHAPPIRIKTFGEFLVHIGDQVLSDRVWKGKRTKALLKAIVACGGTKVSIDHLIDLLWPEIDGDRGGANLKVALSRLRRVGCCDGEPPLPWIKVRDRRVSLIESLCSVDCICFCDTICQAMKDGEDANFMVQALDLYTDDFLKWDINDPWIHKRREELRELFLKGVTTLTDWCLKSGEPEKAIRHLKKAIDKEPINEELYVCLMDCHIARGFPSLALKVYKQAKTVLSSQLGIRPGPTLTRLANQAGDSTT